MTATMATLAKRNHVQVLGNPNATETLMLVHGLGTDQTVWHKITPFFLKHFKVVLLDHLGAGRSDTSQFQQHRYLDLSQYASDLVEVCDAYRLENIHIVGHSAGAMIGALATLQAPARFKRLVMMAASPRYLQDEGYNGGLSEQDVSRIYSELMRNPATALPALLTEAAIYPEDPDLHAYFSASLQQVNRNHVLTVLCAILQSDYRDTIRRITVPTHIIQSRQDYFVPMDVALYLHHQIPGSTLTVIRSRGHFPQLSAPGDIVAALQKFLMG
jgi:sigma-B regulation protein RsbQ